MNPKQLVTLGDLENFKQELISEVRKIVKSGNSQKEKKWIKSRDIKKIFPVSPGKLQTMRKSGALTYMQIGGSIYYDQDDINLMFEKFKIGPKE